MGLTLYVGTNKVNQGFYVSFFLTFSAGEALKFDDSPTTYAAKKENVDQVLQFMASQRIKMRQISSKGNQKSDKQFEVFAFWHYKSMNHLVSMLAELNFYINLISK